MSKFLETYGVAIFTLVLVAILIAFAGPLGMKIKNATTDKVSQTEEIGSDEVYVATTGRPKPPKTAVDKVYCIYYNNGEMTISQKETEPEAGRTVVRKGFYSNPSDCTTGMKTVRFIGAVKPKNCANWFNMCENLIRIKNLEYLYTNECTSMFCMFNRCWKLTNLDVSRFDTSNVTNMHAMFYGCNVTSLDVSHFDTSNVTDMSSMFGSCDLTSLDLSGFDTSKVTDMSYMFYSCCSLTSLDLSGFDTSKVTSMSMMFYNCGSLTSLDLSGFYTMSGGTGNSSMFTYCDSLKTITTTQTVKDRLLSRYSSADVPSDVNWIIK